MGDGFMRYLTVSHAVEACHVQQQLNLEHVTIRQLVCMHTLCKSIVYIVHIENASTMLKLYMHRINTGKIILLMINYKYIIQWNLCQRSPELGARLA